jgi:hypothetical protein
MLLRGHQVENENLIIEFVQAEVIDNLNKSQKYLQFNSTMCPDFM